MNFKPFFIHLHNNNGQWSYNYKKAHANGYTLYISSDKQVFNSIGVHIAQCSKQDQFSKEIGRNRAENLPKEIAYIPAKHLTILLAKLAQDLNGHSTLQKHFKLGITPSLYTWVYKYLLEQA